MSLLTTVVCTLSVLPLIESFDSHEKGVGTGFVL
jgi:hypothetical protein